MYLYLLLKAERNCNLTFDDLSCVINDIFQSASIVMEVFVLEKDHLMQELRMTLDYKVFN